MKIIELEEISSTNDYLKELDPKTDTIVTAKRQTAGRGTKGRSFDSSDGGLYLSILRIYKNFPAERAFEIMINGCVAVCRTLERFGITPVVRWANDVLADGRKICGTLIENTFSNGCITRSVLGAGINVNNKLPSELKHIAVSMREITGKEFDISEVRSVFTENLQKTFTIADYKSYINWFGQPVTLKTEQGDKIVTALDVDSQGRLIVDWCGNMLEISSAEVSLRI